MRGLRPAWTIFVAVVLVVPVVVGIVRGDSPSVLVPALALGLSSVWVIRVSQRQATTINIGLLTALTMLFSYLLKWVVPRDLNHRVAVRLGPDVLSEALVLAAVFGTTFTLAYVAAARLQRNVPRRDGGTVRMSTTRPGVVLLISIVLLITRQVIAARYQVGVPGKAAIPLPGGGLLYFLTTYGPLAGGAVLLMSSRSRHRGWGALVLLAYGAIGVAIGWRSYPVTATLVLVATSMTPTIEARGPVWRRRTAWALAAILALAGVMAVTSRQVDLQSGDVLSPADIFVARAGGIDYLAPVVAEVAGSGTDLRRLAPGVSADYIRTDVYGLPVDALTGFAPTLLGWAYSIAGVGAIALTAALSGVLGATVDAFRFDKADPRRPLLVIGAVIAWKNLLWEGTPVPAAAGFCVFLGFILLLGGPSVTRSLPITPRQAPLVASRT